MAKILGLGGLFVNAKRPTQLAKWYAKWLGLAIEDWGGIRFFGSSLPPRAYPVWKPFAASTDYFRPSRKGFMFNLVVDDLDGTLERISRVSFMFLVAMLSVVQFVVASWFIVNATIDMIDQRPNTALEPTVTAPSVLD
jgi:hypothetical protein